MAIFVPSCLNYSRTNTFALTAFYVLVYTANFTTAERSYLSLSWLPVSKLVSRSHLIVGGNSYRIHAIHEYRLLVLLFQRADYERCWRLISVADHKGIRCYMYHRWEQWTLEIISYYKALKSPVTCIVR